MRALAHWIQQRESSALRGLTTAQLVARLDAHTAGLILTLPLFWLSYPTLLFEVFGFNPNADLNLGAAQSWQLIVLLGLHLGFCHWLAVRLSRLQYWLPGRLAR